MPYTHSRATLLQLLLAIVTVTALLAFPGLADAGSLSLAWDRSPGPSVAGYVVSWGERSGAHTHEADVGSLTTFTIQELEDGQRYYVVVQAYNPGRRRSSPSNEASGRGGPHPLDRFSSQLRWNPVHDSRDLGLTGTGA